MRLEIHSDFRQYLKLGETFTFLLDHPKSPPCHFQPNLCNSQEHGSTLDPNYYLPVYHVIIWSPNYSHHALPITITMSSPSTNKRDAHITQFFFILITQWKREKIEWRKGEMDWYQARNTPRRIIYVKTHIFNHSCCVLIGWCINIRPRLKWRSWNDPSLLVHWAVLQ